VTADDLIVALRQLIERARTHGIKVVGGTLLPYSGAGYYSEKGDVIRDAVNRWIRTSGAFDAVVDFDAIIRDSSDPKKMRAEYDSGDHLHPGDAGYKAMAEAVNLAIFTKH
jgi:lysophospholipase L1-like esterase